MKLLLIITLSLFSSLFFAQDARAASITISGRVTTQNGRSIANVVMTLTDMFKNTSTTTTNSLGYYWFTEAVAGQTYILEAKAKHYFIGYDVKGVNAWDDVEFNFVGERLGR